MHPMTQTGLALLALALSVLTFLIVGSLLYKLLERYAATAGVAEKAILALLLAVAAVGALLMFIGSRL